MYSSSASTCTAPVEASLTPGSQGSAPEATPPSTVASSKPTRILACVLCQSRKIKCDRTFPCSSCIKAQVRCVPSTPAPPRKRRRPNQDLQQRLARCEEMLKAYAGVKPEAASPRTPHSVPPEDLRWQPTGKLVREDGNIRFVDNPMLGAIYDEVRTMREMVDDSHSDDATPETMTPDNNSAFALGVDTSPVKVEDVWPEPARLFRLWQLFLDRVNPLTKIIHVPSLLPYVAAATSGSPVPKNIETLLFSIFLMAVVSLTPEECPAMLGCSKEEALLKYSSAVRTNLLRLNFLRSADLTVLQAFVIYLISLQGRYNRHAVWIVNGLAIRMAQKMGLHRDGEALGLSPFETEMRRRLWWQIIMVDAKYAMFSGLSHNLLPTNSDTKAPCNLDDADISPTATEPFQDREGPTEMIFGLMAYKFATFLMDMPGFEGLVMIRDDPDSAPGLGPGPTEEQQAEYRRGVGVLHAQLEEIFNKYCDPKAGPVHEMAIKMSSHLLDRLTELGTPPKQQPEWGSEVKTAKDNTFKLAIGALEHNEVDYRSSGDQSFTWFARLNFHIDIFMYLAGQLCHRTTGKLVERAWKQVDVVYSFHPELFDVANKKYHTLAIHILRAWRKRENVILGQSGHAPEVPSYVVRLRASMSEPDSDMKETVAETQTPSDLYYKSPEFEPAPSMATAGLAPALGTDPEFDHFLGMFDSHMDWNMFGSPPPITPIDGQPDPGLGMYGMGPSAEW